MTHSSFANENSFLGIKSNERLEFLGDAVLDLVISRYLFTTYSDFREGRLSKFRSVLVREETLAEIARKLRIHDFICLGKGEEKKRSALRDSVLSDAVEALFGGVYIDGGYEKAKTVILSLYKEHLAEIKVVEGKFNSKTKLIESSRKLFGYLPEFRRLSDSGPEHAKVFRISIYINNNFVTHAKGSSIKKAEHSAAKNALALMERSDSNFMKKYGKRMILKNS